MAEETTDTRRIRREQAGDRSVEFESSEEARAEAERAETRAAMRRGMRATMRFTK